jgi:hypothetical protein
MNITVGKYYFQGRNVLILPPHKVIKETNLCYFTEHGRFLKSEINIPCLKSPTHYPTIEVAMVDASETELRERLASWFTDEASRIKNNLN